MKNKPKKIIKVSLGVFILIIMSVFLINLPGKEFKDRNLSNYSDDFTIRLNQDGKEENPYQFLPSIDEENHTPGMLVPGKDDVRAVQVNIFKNIGKAIGDGFRNAIDNLGKSLREIWGNVQDEFVNWLAGTVEELLQGFVVDFFEGAFNVKEVPVIGDDQYTLTEQEQRIKEEIALREKELSNIPALERELEKSFAEIEKEIANLPNRRDRDEGYRLLEQEKAKYYKEIQDLKNQLNYQLNQLRKQLRDVEWRIGQDPDGYYNPNPPADGYPGSSIYVETVNSYKYVSSLVDDFTYNELRVNLSCGDEVYVTTCSTTNRNEAMCQIDSINGTRIGVASIPKLILRDTKPSASDCGYKKLYAGMAGAKYYERKGGEPKVIPCGSEIDLVGSINQACTFQERDISRGAYDSTKPFCEATYEGRTVYVQWYDITERRPDSSACSKNECVSERPLKNQTHTETVTMNVCYKNDNGRLIPDVADEHSMYTCAPGYTKVMKENYWNSTCKTDSYYVKNTCSKEFEYRCVVSDRPIIAGGGGYVGPNHYGTIRIKGYDNNAKRGLRGYQIYTDLTPTVNSDWIPFANRNYEAEESATVGIYFATIMTVDNIMAYPTTISIHDDDLSTTANIEIRNAAGTHSFGLRGIKSDVTLGSNYDMKSSEYVLLNNKNALKKDSVFANGFDLLTNGYEVDVEADQVAVYATLTSEDASYVDGYGPRTVTLNYGRNVILVKIQNKEGKERAYTFVVNRRDVRNNNNTISNITTSVGELTFDPYVSDYTIEVPKNTQTVDVNASLINFTTAFVKGYEPKTVTLSSDITTSEIKTISDAGIVRSYLLTFVKTGTEIEETIENSVNLSSLTITGANIRFDKNTTSYNIGVGYEVTNLEVNAYPESANATVTIPKHIPLQPGPNNLEIIVTNGPRKKVYNVFINRKEENLEVSSDAKLATLTVQDYNINFKPDVHDYNVRIKNEKTLLFTATPAHDRAEVYMYGNNDLTAYSTVRIKVIAEDGTESLYSVDIVKDLFDKDFEKTAAIFGGIIIVVGAILIVVIRKRKVQKSYAEN